MILVFPDLDTLKLCLTSGVLPPEVTLSPVVSGVTDDPGAPGPWVETRAKLPKSLPEQLRKLGVQQARSYPSASEELDNWLQVLPVVRQAAPVQPGPQTPVLFELPDPSYLPVVVGEMLRLSNDRQSFRWLEEGDKPGPVLLRVVGPPYYTLLRALDREQIGDSGVRAYVEPAPKVWVEIGWTHPLVQKIQPPKGQILLLQPPRRWMHVTDEPFRDIYEILDFKLPQSRLDWDAAELRHRLRVPLRLIESDARDPELWVLRENAVDQLDALVRDSKESLIQRLIFAVGANGGSNTIVLRVRPSKQPPPQLVLDAQAYCSYLKLPNLFLPVGTRLHPILRRDAIRKLLADDPGQINWLEPSAEKPGSFTPHVLPDDAFRPLQDWVDYVLDHDRHALEAWVQEFRFDFQPFVCLEDAAPDRPRPPGPTRRRPSGPPKDSGETAKPAKPPKSEPKAQDEFEVVEAALEPIEALPPSELQKEIAALEKKFTEFEGALDAPERLHLWTELAWRYSATKATADAALCWINRLWEAPEEDEAIRRELIRLWLNGEKATFEGSFGSFADRMFKTETPAPGELRAVVAGILAGSVQNPPAPVILERLPKLQQFLERHERSIGVRAAWLGHAALARLAHHDALGLARVRDRLLDRLIHDGLSPERDLPNFLRTAGHHDSERVRVVQQQMSPLRDIVLKWCDECDQLPNRSTYAVKDASIQIRDTSSHYIDLLFAFGFARVGQSNISRELLHRAQDSVARLKDRAPQEIFEVTDLLAQAFQYRVDQSLHGHRHSGPLPLEWRKRLDLLLPKGAQSAAQSAGHNPRYVVDRLREQSRVLEPQERFEPYRDFHVERVPELSKELARLPEIKDAKELLSRMQRLIAGGVDGRPPAPQDEALILVEGLMLAPRVGESLAQTLLARVEPTLDKLLAQSADAKLLNVQAGLLDRAFVIAATYDRIELARQLLKRFLLVLQRAHQGRQYSHSINASFGQCLRSLRKLGLQDDIEAVIGQMSALITSGKSMSSLKASIAPGDWPTVVQTLLHIAGGWLYFGSAEPAKAILDAARELLVASNNSAADSMSLQAYTNLACTYVSVLSFAPIETTMRRLDDLFARMRRFRDTFTTASFYSRLHLNIIESVVLAVVSDDFALGPSARRWLDEDEYLIRRRIHADHRRMKESAGV